MKTTQLKIAEVDQDEREKELDAMGDEHAVRLEQVFAACNKVMREMGPAGSADELERMWGKRGRPVSAGVLKNALDDARGNYFRFEWVMYFATKSAEVRDLILAIGFDTPKDPVEELDDIHDVLREDLGKTGEALIRKAKARRRRKR